MKHNIYMLMLALVMGFQLLISFPYSIGIYGKF